MYARAYETATCTNAFKRMSGGISVEERAQGKPSGLGSSQTLGDKSRRWSSSCGGAQGTAGPLGLPSARRGLLIDTARVFPLA